MSTINEPIGIGETIVIKLIKGELKHWERNFLGWVAYYVRVSQVSAALADDPNGAERKNGSLIVDVYKSEDTKFEDLPKYGIQALKQCFEDGQDAVFNGQWQYCPIMSAADLPDYSDFIKWGTYIDPYIDFRNLVNNARKDGIRSLTML